MLKIKINTISYPPLGIKQLVTKASSYKQFISADKFHRLKLNHAEDTFEYKTTMFRKKLICGSCNKSFNFNTYKNCILTSKTK